MFAKAISTNALYGASCLVEAERAVFCAALEQDERAVAASAALCEWAAAQTDRTAVLLASLAAHREGGLAAPAIAALAELTALVHSAAAHKPPPLQTHWIAKVLFFWFLFVFSSSSFLLWLMQLHVVRFIGANFEV